MYGVEDLLLHVMYVNKREKLEPLKHFAIDKVLLFVLSACYKQGHDIQYDYLFEKSVYGARVNRNLLKDTYKKFDRTVNLDYATCIPVLEEDNVLDDLIIRFIKISNSSSGTLPRYLIGSEPYQKDIDAIKETEKDNSYFSLYPYWTKKDIIDLLSGGEEPKVNIDNRIPLNKTKYAVMCKFLRLQGYDSTEKFTREEIMDLHAMPYHLIRSIEENGCYYDSKLD